MPGKACWLRHSPTAGPPGRTSPVSYAITAGVEFSLATSGPIVDSQVDAADAIASSPAAVPALILALLLFHFIGLPWLTFGMVRAHTLSLAAALAATAGTACAFFGSGSRVETLGWVVLGVMHAYIGWTVARPSTVGTVGIETESLAPSAA